MVQATEMFQDRDDFRHGWIQEVKSRSLDLRFVLHVLVLLSSYGLHFRVDSPWSSAKQLWAYILPVSSLSERKRDSVGRSPGLSLTRTWVNAQPRSTHHGQGQ